LPCWMVKAQSPSEEAAAATNRRPRRPRRNPKPRQSKPRPAEPLAPVEPPKPAEHPAKPAPPPPPRAHKTEVKHLVKRSDVSAGKASTQVGEWRRDCRKICGAPNPVRSCAGSLTSTASI
jgi:hypothetical protein